jgi:hypothetical protein
MLSFFVLMGNPLARVPGAVGVALGVAVLVLL